MVFVAVRQRRLYDVSERPSLTTSRARLAYNDNLGAYILVLRPFCAFDPYRHFFARAAVLQ